MDNEITQSQVDNAPTPAEMMHNTEKDAFVRMTQENGETIPSNFKDAGAWYDSLKNAQGQYTQGQQEIADLKQQYNENGVTNPAFQDQPAVEGGPTPEAPEVDSLRIGDGTAPIDTSVPDEIAEQVSPGEWNDWGNIIDANNGELPETLRNAIKMRMNVDDSIIDDYMSIRQENAQANVAAAASVVGGQPQLNNIMEWASNNLSDQERGAVNGQLAGPGYQTAILGLQARMNNANGVSVARSNEPRTTQNRTQQSDATQTIIPYRTEQEMFADQRNPRYRTDAAYRNAVEHRIVATHTHGYRA
jgi:hypothetical protein